MATYDDCGEVWETFEYKPDGEQRKNGVFVLGCADTYRNTLISQQHRALTLVNALIKAKRLTAGQSVGIVGGGVAGLTAAMQCVVAGGANVTVFEKDDNLLSMFANANHRILHPGLFNWPKPGWDIDDTKNLPQPLPFLNWKFESAARIATKMRKEFGGFERIRRKDRSGGPWIDVQKGKYGKATFASWSPDGLPRVSTDYGIQRFDHLIIAVGFGVEESFGGKSYWRSDDFSDPGDLENPTKYVVVGRGDGGLFDYLRLRLHIKDERWIVNQFLKRWKSAERQEIEREIATIERNGGATWSQDNLQIKYQELAGQSGEARKFLTRQDKDGKYRWIRRDTDVVLVGRREEIITGKAAPINRFLVALVLKCAGISRETGKYTKTPNGWEIQGTSHSSYSGRQLVLRAGPRSALEVFSKEIFNYFAGPAASKVSNASRFDFHSRFYTFDGDEEQPGTSGPTGDGLPPTPAPAAFEMAHRRDDVVHENPYLLAGKFEGREREQSDLTAWLEDSRGSRRMLFVCDYGGAGKTALVWHWLNRADVKQRRAELGYREYWATFYARGYGWLALAVGLAKRLGVDIPEHLNNLPAREAMLDGILDRLKQDPWLIVLDGLEREMESFAGEATLHMDSERQDIRKELGEVRAHERYLLSRQFSGFLKGLLNTRAKVLVTSRTLPEDFWSGSRHIPGVEEYPFREMQSDDAIKVWAAHTGKPGKRKLQDFFSLIGHHPQVISIVAAALESSDRSSFEDWLKLFAAEEVTECFDKDSTVTKTERRHRWLERATDDLLKTQSKAWIVLCHIISRSNASSVDNLRTVLLRPGSPFTKNDNLIDSLMALQRRNLLGFDTRSQMIDVHPVVRSHVGKYLIRVWKNEKRDEFASNVLSSLRLNPESGDALLRLLSPENLDEAAKQWEQANPMANGVLNYGQSFTMLKEFYPPSRGRPFLENLPTVSLRKLQASVLFNTANAALATGAWEDATILNRRAKLAFELCGELEKAAQCQQGENWQLLYGGSLFDCERDFLRLLQRKDSSTAETDIYWLAMSLAIRQDDWAKPLLRKIGPGESRWTKQTAAEAQYYLKNYRNAAEILDGLESDAEPPHPAQQLWEWLTLGMAKLRLGERAGAARLLDQSQQESDAFYYRIVLLFSQSSYAECVAAEAMASEGTARFNGLERARTLFAQTVKLDPANRFQIPMTESYLGHAITSFALSDKKGAEDSALKALEVAGRGHIGFGYASGLDRVEKFIQRHFPHRTLARRKNPMPAAVKKHKKALDSFMKKFLKTGARK